MAEPPRDGVRISPEQQKRRRQRNIALAVVLMLLVAFFYVLTFVKGPGVATRGL
jgi:hypothetical protein